MKSHNEFIEDVKHASALPAQTCRALGPESQEDIAMYANDSQQSNEAVADTQSTTNINSADIQSKVFKKCKDDKMRIKDALCEENVGGKE